MHGVRPVTLTNDAPGMVPSRLFTEIDDKEAARLVPDGAFVLVKLLRPDLLTGEDRCETLGRLLSVELALDDPTRRLGLLAAVPADKITELETRAGAPLDELGAEVDLDRRTRRALLGFFGSALATEQRVDSISAATTVKASRGLFDHQKRAAAAVEYLLRFDSGRAMLHLPTGVGKTRTAMSIVASHLRSQGETLVVWLANTRELLEQAAGEFEATWAAVGDRTVCCHRFWSSYDPPADDLADGIIVAGLSKLHSYGNVRERLWGVGDRASLVVFDEAHQAVASTYKDIVETIVTRRPRTALLGLSATPGRTWGDPDADAAVADLFHGNKVTLDFGKENPIRRLISDGYLAEAEFALLNVEPGLQPSLEDLAEVTDALDIPERLAEALGDDEQRNLRILQRLVNLTDRHRRVLVFAASVRNADLLASVCRALGIAADAVTGTTDAVERERMIARFKRPGGAARVLVNYGVLTAGFDAPAASAALIARPTKSLVLYSQMVGRVIRGLKAEGTATCEVVTVVDTTLPGFGNVAEAFLNWEDVWTP